MGYIQSGWIAKYLQRSRKDVRNLKGISLNACAHTHTHAHTHARTHARTHAHTHTHTATHHVQEVETPEGQGLVVECVFAEGLSQNTTCTVVVEGEEGQCVDTSRGPLSFPDLPNGNYSVTIYDGVWEMVKDSRLEPAVVISVEVSGQQSPDTPTPSPAAGAQPNSKRIPIFSINT